MATTPDFAGFTEAQERLRAAFGHAIVFTIPGAVVWPPGTALDPESGTPFDPSVAPESTGETTTTVTVSVVDRPMGLSRRGIDDSVERKAIGWVEEGGVVLIVNTEDWPLIRDAESFVYADSTYAIRQIEHDFLGAAERYLIYGSQA